MQGGGRCQVPLPRLERQQRGQHGGTTDRVVGETGVGGVLRMVEIPSIEDHRGRHPRMHLREIRRAEFCPLRSNRQRVRAVERRHRFREVMQPISVDRANVFQRFRVMNVHRGAQFEQPVDQN